MKIKIIILICLLFVACAEHTNKYGYTAEEQSKYFQQLSPGDQTNVKYFYGINGGFLQHDNVVEMLYGTNGNICFVFYETVSDRDYTYIFVHNHNKDVYKKIITKFTLTNQQVIEETK